jgi:hypothetical protein
VLALVSVSGAGVIGRRIERRCGLGKGKRECQCGRWRWFLVLGFGRRILAGTVL